MIVFISVGRQLLGVARKRAAVVRSALRSVEIAAHSDTLQHSWKVWANLPVSHRQTSVLSLTSPQVNATHMRSFNLD